MFTEITEKQIEDWKKKYGKDGLLCLNFNEGKVYFKKPSKSPNYFHLAKRAMVFQQQDDTLSAGEVVFNECYLGGLGELKDIDRNTSVYINSCLQCTNLVEVLEANFTTV